MESCGLPVYRRCPFGARYKVRFYNAGKKSAPHIISTHCVFLRHALASKALPDCLKIVLKQVTKCVNFVRARAVDHRLFQTIL